MSVPTDNQSQVFQLHSYEIEGKFYQWDLSP